MATVRPIGEAGIVRAEAHEERVLRMPRSRFSIVRTFLPRSLFRAPAVRRITRDERRRPEHLLQDERKRRQTPPRIVSVHAPIQYVHSTTVANRQGRHPPVGVRRAEFRDGIADEY